MLYSPQKNSIGVKTNTIFFPIILLLATMFPALLRAQTDRATVLAHGRTHAQILAAPDMMGRGYQDEGHLKAARYIAEQFKKFGLQAPKGELGGESPYFQPFRASLNLVTQAPILRLNEVELQVGEDFIVKGNSGRGEIENAKVVNLGYGLPEDFSKSFKGKIVMFRSGLPARITKDKTLKESYKRFGSDDVKLDFATKMQAEGVIILKEKLTASFSPVPVEIPVIEVLSDRVPGKRKKKVKRADLAAWTQFKSLESQNVIGVIPGTEFPDSVIIVSAHYDHLGKQGDAIFYGGNDNASGTSMMLNMAEYFSAKENRPRYTMAFIGFGGEEAGLLGSRHFVEKQPLFPLENTVFILNLDLMANGDKGITAVAGLEFPDLFKELQDLNAEMQAVPKIKGRGNSPNSDHYFFVKNGVKGMFIFTMGGPPHYHDVHDTYEEMRFSRYYEVQMLMQAYLKAMMN